MWETRVQSLGWEDPLEKEMATHSSILAWRVRCDLATKPPTWPVQFSSVAQSCPTLWPHEPQHTRPPCPSPTSRVYPNPCPLSQWCHPTILSSVDPSPPALNLSQHQGLFQWVSSSHHIYALIYDICFSPSDLLNSVWQTLGSSISFVEMTQFRPLSRLSNIPLYICTTFFLSIHLSVVI